VAVVPLRSPLYLDPVHPMKVLLVNPLSHNKTAFTTRRLGADCLNNLKALTRELNALTRFTSV
jgi:hypothetical protein